MLEIFKFKRPKWVPKWLSLPLIIFVVFVISLLFFGDNNFLLSSKYKAQANELKSLIKAQEDSTAVYNAKVEELNTDRESLERLAREKYGMKRINEEVYVTDIP